MQYDGHSDMFIDKEGYGGGDAKLIYTYDPDDGTATIVDMERGLRSSSYTTFPTEITYGGVKYTVVGRALSLEGSSYVDSSGIVYKLNDSDSTASVENYRGSLSSLTIPATVTYDNGTDTLTYTVTKINCKDFKTANITDITFIVPKVGDYKLNQSFQGNGTLKAVKFVVDGDDPNVTVPGEAGWVDIQKAFMDCTGLTSVTLPNVLHRADLAFAGCTSLGSSEDEPLVFNTLLRTKSETDYMFSGCTGLKYLEIGKNVNKISTIFGAYSKDSVTYSGCDQLKVIYNTSTSISESDIAASILESGSSKVLLYMLSGGEFTQVAAVSGDTTSGYTITMPKATYNGVSIPCWTHKDGTVWFDSGANYSSFKPWGTAETAWSYYYYAMYGTCTVTYHLYKDKTQVCTATQTVPCMYNTPLYDASKFDTEYQSAITDVDQWIVKDSVDDDALYSLGQAVTLFTDLDLFLPLDNDCSYNVTLTIKWDYIDPDTHAVTTYSKEYTEKNSEGDTLPSKSDFISDAGITSDLEELVGNYVRDPDGRVWYFEEHYSKFFCDLTLTVAPASDFSSIAQIAYVNEVKDTRIFRQSPCVGFFTVAPNPYYNDYSPFSHFCWWASSLTYNPGDIMICRPYAVVNLYAQWDHDDPSVHVVYNLNEDIKEELYPVDESVALSSKYARPGYTLIGWSYTEKGADNGNVNFPLDTEVRMVNNLVLYAVWEKDSSLTVIVDDLLLSADDLPETYEPVHTVVGTLSSGNKVEVTVTYEGTDLPKSVGVYAMSVTVKVTDSAGTDVTGNYTISVVSGFLTIYSGDHSAVAD